MLDDTSKRIVRCWSELDLRELPRTPGDIAMWLSMPVGDVEQRMRALAALEQLPGWEP